MMRLPTCSQSLVEVIERGIQSRTGGSIRELQVSVEEDGIVVLSGRTSTYYSKQLATHAALDAGDDLTLRNNIEVS